MLKTKVRNKWPVHVQQQPLVTSKHVYGALAFKNERYAALTCKAGGGSKMLGCSANTGLWIGL